MLNLLKYKDENFQIIIEEIINSRKSFDEDITNKVKDIMLTIKNNGDSSLFEYIKKYDNVECSADNICYNKDDINSVNIDEDADSEEEDIEDIKETEEDILMEEIRTLKEDKIRVLAEMENLRKRFEREKIDSIKSGSVYFARDILSPGDNLERALSAINKEEDHPQSIKNLSLIHI